MTLILGPAIKFSTPVVKLLMTAPNVLAPAFDLGLLLVSDHNVYAGLDQALHASQTLHLVQALEDALSGLPSSKESTGSLVVVLPKAASQLPRSKPLPKPKAQTRWEKFAQIKGIKKVKRSAMVYSETAQKWIPRHGGKSARIRGMDHWCEELK